MSMILILWTQATLLYTGKVTHAVGIDFSIVNDKFHVLSPQPLCSDGIFYSQRHTFKADTVINRGTVTVVPRGSPHSMGGSHAIFTRRFIQYLNENLVWAWLCRSPKCVF